VAHTYNPSYSGGRDQEDCSSKAAPANSSARPYLKKLFTKIGLVRWLKVKVLSSSPSTTKKKKKKEKKERKKKKRD
jgi:ribosomal protein S21